MENSDEAMKVAIIFYVKNKIEIDVIRRLIIKFQSFSDDWPTSEATLNSRIYLKHQQKQLIKWRMIKVPSSLFSSYVLIRCILHTTGKMVGDCRIVIWSHDRTSDTPRKCLTLWCHPSVFPLSIPANVIVMSHMCTVHLHYFILIDITEIWQIGGKIV